MLSLRYLLLTLQVAFCRYQVEIPIKKEQTMGLKDAIHQGDVINLKSIKKKLNLPLKKLAQAQKLQSDTTLTEEQKAAFLLNVPEGVSVSEYLQEKLTEKEIETVRKFVKFV